MANKNILILDDEMVIRKLCERTLGRGYVLGLAESIQEGLKLLREGSWDLLISDLRLPDGCGVEVIRDFKKRFPGKEVVIITGSPSPQEHLKEALQLGVKRCLFKPFDVEELKATVRQCLGE